MLSVPEGPSADSEHLLSFPLGVPWVSAEFWQSFGTKKPRPRCITAGGGEAYLKPLDRNRYGGA